MSFHPLQDPSIPPRTAYTESALPAPRTETLAGPIAADIAIIGGGFTGLSAAVHAAEAGLRAVVLEANEIGWGSSGRNQGQVVPALKQEHDHAIRTFGRERGERLMSAAGDGPDLVYGLIERLGIPCNPIRKGIVAAAHSRAALEQMRRRTEFWQARGAPVEMYERDAAADLIGSDLYFGASLDKRGGTINALSYVRGLAGAAMRMGARIFTHALVQKLERSEGKWSVVAPGGTVAADTVLICTNAYVTDLWPGLRRSIIPIRAYQLATKPISDNVRRTILPGGQALGDTARVMIGIRWQDNHRLQVGGSDATTGAHREPLFELVERRLLRVFPQLSRVEWDVTWSGWMAMTPDHYPRLHELAPGLLAGYGYNGRGIVMATTMGRELAARAAGARLEDLAIPATPLRQIGVYAARRPIVYGLLSYYRLRDYLDRRSLRSRRRALPRQQHR